MAVLKCKMCGANLTITSGSTIAECEYCGTKQTLPGLSEEVVQNLFNRANVLRLKCEFDKAEQIYERILLEHAGECEAHWGIVLCKYGVEYVEDPMTHRRIPTCHRTSYDAVLTDTDYLSAIKYANDAQRNIYKAEAREIDKIQKSILSIAKDEKPFDVFLCYKETGEDGKRTIDSAIANDIYHQLTLEGLNTFYAPITLEDKLGQEYEPYIFAALNSARVMLVIGTKPQHFNAVWVKNEWGRFLRLMKSDRSKLLIPCYRDIDAYDLPEEFAHLQAHDMSKIGFINDIVRGIRKVLAKAGSGTAENMYPMATGTINTASLLERAFLFVEEGNYFRADELCEKVLDQEPRNAKAYLCKLLIELNARSKSDLVTRGDFESSINYQRILKFGDDALRQEISEYLRRAKQDPVLEAIYTSAVQYAERYKNDFFDVKLRISCIKKSVEELESISFYKDSRKKIEEYKAYLQDIENNVGPEGCYVATAIYGSYDCPQVWTLRRYRDDTLARTWYGRLFIRAYYAVSPTLVKWFGDTKFFKSVWKDPLDRMVSKLNAKGVEDTPYCDRNW